MPAVVDLKQPPQRVSGGGIKYVHPDYNSDEDAAATASAAKLKRLTSTAMKIRVDR